MPRKKKFRRERFQSEEIPFLSNNKRHRKYSQECEYVLKSEIIQQNNASDDLYDINNLNYFQDINEQIQTSINDYGDTKLNDMHENENCTIQQIF